MYDGAAGVPARQTGEDARPSINPVPRSLPKCRRTVAVRLAR